MSYPMTPEVTADYQTALSRQGTSTGKAYAKRNKDFRFAIHLCVDPASNHALIATQFLPALQPATGKQLTRATLIRRAIRLYCQQMLQASRGGLTAVLESERNELLKMVNNRKPA